MRILFRFLIVVAFALIVSCGGSKICDPSSTLAELESIFEISFESINTHNGMCYLQTFRGGRRFFLKLPLTKNIDSERLVKSVQLAGGYISARSNFWEYKIIPDSLDWWDAPENNVIACGEILRRHLSENNSDQFVRNSELLISLSRKDKNKQVVYIIAIVRN